MDYFIGGLIGLAVGVFGVSTAEYVLKYNLVDLIIEFFKKLFYKSEASIKKDINKL